MAKFKKPSDYEGLTAANEDELEQENEAVLDKDNERFLELVAQKEAEIRVLREQVEAEQRKQAKLDEMQKRWRDGDYTGLANDFPFYVTIHKSEDGHEVPLQVAGHRWELKPGVTYTIPKFALEVLDRAKNKRWFKTKNPITGKPQAASVEEHRHQFSARPAYDQATGWGNEEKAA